MRLGVFHFSALVLGWDIGRVGRLDALLSVHLDLAHALTSLLAIGRMAHSAFVARAAETSPLFAKDSNNSVLPAEKDDGTASHRI